MSELRALDPVADQVKLLDGTVVLIEDLKTRQFFKLLKIITAGSLPLLTSSDLFDLNPDEDPAEFAKRLLAILVLSIPDAENETIAFLRSMVKPAGLIEGRALNKQDNERNNELTARVDQAMANPELDDTVSILEVVVRREANDIQALGKRLGSMFKLAAKTGQLSPSPSASISPSSVPSAEHSTSSSLNTGGPTTSSTTSASVVFDSVSPPSESGGTTSSGVPSSS